MFGSEETEEAAKGMVALMDVTYATLAETMGEPSGATGLRTEARASGP